jgi:hypothetical protein
VLQGLGADYRFPEGTSRSAMAKLVGNSVVPCCMAWVIQWGFSAKVSGHSTLVIYPKQHTPTNPQTLPPKA